MTDRKVDRKRLRQFRPVGGAEASLSRRTGMGSAEPRSVVAYGVVESDTPLIDMLKASRPNTDKFRGGDNVHVSDVISKCVRKIALMRRMNMRHPQEVVYDGLGITFAIGEALHDYVKARFVAGHPDKVWAKWSCVCGEEEYTGLFSDRPSTECSVCGTPVATHNEVPFVHPGYKLSGSPDLLLLLPQHDAFLVTEIKSMAAERWKELCRPLPDHVVQVALYWHIMKHCGFTLVDRCSILYVNKEFSYKLPYKEFFIDPEAVDLSEYWEDLEELLVSDKGGALPQRKICGSDTAPEARKCPVRVTCFGCS